MAAIDTTADKFIGKGLIFPITIDGTGKAPITGGKDLLEASIISILSWTIGTRYMLGEFGTNLESLLQEPNDSVTRALVKHFTVDVISKWEKRLEVLDVQITSKEEYQINIHIKYRVKNTKIEDSFIFPYYSQLIY